MVLYSISVKEERVKTISLNKTMNEFEDVNKQTTWTQLWNQIQPYLCWRILAKDKGAAWLLWGPEPEN